MKRLSVWMLVIFALVLLQPYAGAQTKMSGNVIKSGTLPVGAINATGTPSGSTYLNGTSWADPSITGDVTGYLNGGTTVGKIQHYTWTPNAPLSGQWPYWSGSSFVYADPFVVAIQGQITAVATANQTLSGLPTIDGIQTVDGSVVLLTAQTTGSQNGLWVTHSGAWTRPAWYYSGETIGYGFIAMVGKGGSSSVYGWSMWMMSTNGSITVDTGASTWVQVQYPLNALAQGGATSGQALEWNGSQWVPAAVPGTGTDTSVGLSMPSDFSVSGSPVTTAGTLTVTANTQSANTFKAGPSSGAAAAPTYRTIAAADIAAAFPTDYISGLQLSWGSGTSIKVGSGSAYVQGSTQLVTYSGGTVTGLSTAANTFYYVYLYLSGSTPSIEVSTTAPAAPYQGTARSKTGDTTRRYLGTILANTGGTAIDQFFTDSGGSSFLDRYGESTNVAPFQVLSGGTATTPTTVSCAAVIPATSQFGLIRILNTGVAPSGTSYTSVAIKNSATNGTPSFVGCLPFGSGNSGVAYSTYSELLLLDSSQSLQYSYGIAPSAGGMNLQVIGYKDVR